MNRKDADQLAQKIVGHTMCLSHPNVWFYFSPKDSGINDLFITKDDAKVAKSGVFIGDDARGVIYDWYTGEIVTEDDVFGPTFFKDDPSLTIDRTTSPDMNLQEKIDVLLDSILELLMETKTSPGAMILVEDLIEDCDETAYKRLVILNNYLAQADGPISMKQFANLHHDLYTLE